MIMTFFFFQAEDGIRDDLVSGVQTCALPIFFTFHIDQILRALGGQAFEDEITNFRLNCLIFGDILEFRLVIEQQIDRSEERRVGKECRYRWLQCPEKKTKENYE